MDSQFLNHIGLIIRHHWLEIGGLLTLGFSLWVAFGPMRHRLPPIVSRLGKYSATLKLLSISGFCSFLLYKCLVDDEPSLALNWLLGSLAAVFLAGAVWIFTRKQEIAPSRSKGAPVPHVLLTPLTAQAESAPPVPVIKPVKPTSAGGVQAR